mgnify:CR=1 FL=1
MKVNKEQYLKELNQHLLGIPDAELQDIMYDFQEYFNVGIQEGRSEEDIANSLGDPSTLAKQLRTEYMVKLAKSSPTLQNIFNASLNTMGIDFFKTIGLTLFTIGLSLLLHQLSIINMPLSKSWPIFILGLGVAFEVSYFTNPLRNKANLSLLIPGGILVTVGGLFLFVVMTKYSYLAFLWPIFILAVALGLYQFYYFGSKNVWILIPALITGVTGSIFLVNYLLTPYLFRLFLAGLFIAGGLYVWFKINKKQIT